MSSETISSSVEALTRLAFVTTSRVEQRASESNLTVQQVRLLGILRDREPTINELASHLGTDKSSMSGAVARAERRGLLSRIPDKDDGRVVRVRLEPAGRALVDAASSQFEDDVRQVFAELSGAECTQWVNLTNRLLKAEAECRDSGL